MELFIVTSLAVEKDSDGKILMVKCRCHAVCTTEDRATALAEKYDGSVTSVYADRDEMGKILQYWENPGFVTS
jgi:hypothetical protein